ncbi:uncharacterized protein EI97DRAFT_429678 [Westerdykella ornata]|uniref:SnoaL-like domain-containing protein n=1 Tax=Westerdykella ornata TaxID=318751 RepID=A0A6A6JW01_WESOR|nr:uncharacterized protein EI97DRAFT_429678 [Westerdykella ornata]KAF2279906.1 hypothetical protein EI97DRAFT_429678 [Westerdykella ornata]
MRSVLPFVSVIGFASVILGFVPPEHQMLGSLAARESEHANVSVDPCLLADDLAVNRSLRLSSWLECRVNGFFPYPANGAWDTVFAQTFSPSLLATFNTTHHYNYTGWLELYHSINVTLGQNFAPFKHGFTHTLAIPNDNGDCGGTVYMIGWEGGYHVRSKQEFYATDAAFAVVENVGGGERKITEFRESANIWNTAPLPKPNEWTCGFAADH